MEQNPFESPRPQAHPQEVAEGLLVSDEELEVESGNRDQDAVCWLVGVGLFVAGFVVLTTFSSEHHSEIGLKTGFYINMVGFSLIAAGFVVAVVGPRLLKSRG